MSAAWKTWDAPKPGATLCQWQARRCAWCGYDGFPLARDHCHQTGLIRGLLCAGCNVEEAFDIGDGWQAWREGDHPAAALRIAEVYVGPSRETPLRPTSVLNYYTAEERAAWWAGVGRDVAAGEPWPISAPWTEVATTRYQTDLETVRRAMDQIVGGVA
jgi:hypothetical protein